MKKLIKGYLNFLYNSVTNLYSKELFRFLEPNPNAVLLDAGCWDGLNTVKFAKAIGTKKIMGLELVKSAAAKAARRGINVTVADLNKKIPLKAASVDVIVSNHVIEHLYDVNIFVEQLYKVLRPGGYLVIGTPNLASWHNVFALLIGRQPYSGPTIKVSSQDLMAEMRSEKSDRLTSEIKEKTTAEDAYGHIVVLTYDALLKLLRSNGFKIEASRCFGYHPFPPILAKFLANIDKKHSHYVLVKARKI